MKIKNKELDFISSCTSQELHIENCNLCCKVIGTDLGDSSFNETNLSGVAFKKGDMRGASFEHIGLANSTFKNVNLVRSNFEQVGMSGTIFKQVDMDRSDIEGSGLVNGIIINSDLRGLTVRSCKIADMTVDGYNVMELIKFYKENHKEN